VRALSCRDDTQISATLIGRIIFAFEAFVVSTVLIGRTIFYIIRTEFGRKTLNQPGKPKSAISVISVYRANPETLGFGSYQQSALSFVAIDKKYGGSRI